METIKDLCKEVRGGAYYVKRGVIDWRSHDFDQIPKAIAIGADEFPLFGRGDGNGFKDADLSLEVFTKLPKTGDPVGIDDGLLDELMDDMWWVITELLKKRQGDFPVVFNVVKARVKAVESHDVTLGVQGIVVFLPVSY